MRMKTKDTGGKKENTSDGRRAQPGEWPGELEGGPGGRCSLGRYKSNRLGHTAQLTSRWLHVSFGQGPEKICLFTFPTIFLPARHTEIFVCFFFSSKISTFPQVTWLVQWSTVRYLSPKKFVIYWPVDFLLLIGRDFLFRWVTADWLEEASENHWTFERISSWN